MTENENLDILKTKEMLLEMMRFLIIQEPLLTEIDSKIGDGDHGYAIKRGFSYCREELSNADFTSINEMFKFIGLNLLKSMGGASGVLFATLFTGGLKDEELTSEFTLKFFSNILSKSFKAIKERGRSVEGKKTLLDTVGPASRALTKSFENNETFAKGLEKAALAAYTGCQETRNMIAGYGRSRKLGEHALGIPDPGAVSMYYIFGAMNLYVNKIEIKLIEI